MSMKVRGGEKFVTCLIDGQMMFNGATRLSRADVISSWKKNVEKPSSRFLRHQNQSPIYSLSLRNIQQTVDTFLLSAFYSYIPR